MEPTPDTAFTLTRADLELAVSPYGASLRGLSRVRADGAREPIVTGYTGAKAKMGGEGDVLIPFPGRISQGRYTFGGQTYQMDKTDHEGPNAIHGFLRQTLWETEGPSGEGVSFTTAIRPDAHAGYPFALGVRVTYTVTEDGMACAFALQNTGDGPAPVAAGFHPYFTVGSDTINGDTLQVPMESYLEFNADLVPTGKVIPVEGTPFDFRQPRPVGDVAINTCYLSPRRDPDGRVRIRLADPAAKRSLTVWMDEAFDYVVLYSGDPLPESHRRRALAIEPMTCASDAFNRPDWGLVSLAPGETFSGTWGVSAG